MLLLRSARLSVLRTHNELAKLELRDKVREAEQPPLLPERLASSSRGAAERPSLAPVLPRLLTRTLMPASLLPAPHRLPPTLCDQDYVAAEKHYVASLAKCAVAYGDLSPESGAWGLRDGRGTYEVAGRLNKILCIPAVSSNILHP